MTIHAIREKFRTPIVQRLFRYSMASVVAVIVSTVCIAFFVGVVRLGAIAASTLSTIIAAVPSYEMNRKWAWGKSGRSHFWREVVPFWSLALLGWAVSTFSVKLMENYAKHHHFTHLSKTFWVTFVYVGAFGVLWVGKFIIFNSVMFVHHHHETDEEPHDTPAAA
jgi:putative flippase GtrA